LSYAKLSTSHQQLLAINYGYLFGATDGHSHSTTYRRVANNLRWKERAGSSQKSPPFSRLQQTLLAPSDSSSRERTYKATTRRHRVSVSANAFPSTAKFASPLVLQIHPLSPSPSLSFLPLVFVDWASINTAATGLKHTSHRTGERPAHVVLEAYSMCISLFLLHHDSARDLRDYDASDFHCLLSRDQHRDSCLISTSQLLGNLEAFQSTIALNRLQDAVPDIIDPLQRVCDDKMQLY